MQFVQIFQEIIGHVMIPFTLLVAGAAFATIALIALMAMAVAAFSD